MYVTSLLGYLSYPRACMLRLKVMVNYLASKSVDGGSIQGSQGSFGSRVASPSKSNLDLGTGV
jgi:hypothetical protein